MEDLIEEMGRSVAEAEEAPEPAWGFIGELWASGEEKDIGVLAKRFGLSERALRAWLVKHYEPGAGVRRTREEMGHAGAAVKDELVTVMLRLSQGLREKVERGEGFTTADVGTLERLVNTAAKLFSWPSPKAIDVLALGGLLGGAAAGRRLGGGINLELMRLSPAQLRERGQNGGG